MSKTTKTLLVVFGAIAGIFFLIAAGAWFWWSSNSGNIVKSGSEAMIEGQTHGRGTNEASCVAAVIARHKGGAKDISTAMVSGLWLKSCLEASKPSDALCKGAPSPDEVVAMGKWIGSICVNMGAADPYCPAALQALPKYCHGPERTEKIKNAK